MIMHDIYSGEKVISCWKDIIPNLFLFYCSLQRVNTTSHGGCRRSGQSLERLKVLILLEFQSAFMAVPHACGEIHVCTVCEVATF